MIRFSCPHCFAGIAAPDGKAGHDARCPNCQVRLKVPGQPVPTTLDPATTTLHPASVPTTLYQPKQTEIVGQPLPVASVEQLPTLGLAPQAVPAQAVIVCSRPRRRAGGGRWLLALLMLVLAGGLTLVLLRDDLQERLFTRKGGGGDLETIRQHRFWRVAISREQAESFVAAVCNGSRGDVVCVDDKSRVGVWPSGGEAAVFRENLAWIKGSLPPEGLGQRFLYVDLKSIATRPSRSQAVRLLKRALDEADFR